MARELTVSDSIVVSSDALSLYEVISGSGATMPP